MAKKKKKKITKKSDYTPKSKKMTKGDYVALGVFIALAVLIVGFTSYYFFFYKPSVETTVTAKGEEFIYRYRNIDYNDYSNDPVLELLTPQLGSQAQGALQEELREFQIDEYMSTAQEIEAEVKDVGWDSAKVRVKYFWNVKSLTQEEAIWTYLDLTFEKVEVENEDGDLETRWLVGSIMPPNVRESNEIISKKEQPIKELVLEYFSDELEVNLEDDEIEVVESGLDRSTVRVFISNEDIKDVIVVNTGDNWEIDSVNRAPDEVFEKIALREELKSTSIDFIEKYYNISDYETFSFSPVVELLTDERATELKEEKEDLLLEFIDAELKAQVSDSEADIVKINEDEAVVKVIYQYFEQGVDETFEDWMGKYIEFVNVDGEWLINEFYSVPTDEIIQIREDKN
ncbi:hypothetical protein PRVXT_000848 [Proteinivorax tanatarense]|uniref:Uncharacterized protein n=1 Tax=Proteinivorax tanatarense TaxID=1260629 RepID=A0AAU7VNT2_9FIRM